jgi:hypothetical protein
LDTQEIKESESGVLSINSTALLETIGARENFILNCFIICTLHQILLG